MVMNSFKHKLSLIQLTILQKKIMVGFAAVRVPRLFHVFLQVGPCLVYESSLLVLHILGSLLVLGLLEEPLLFVRS